MLFLMVICVLPLVASAEVVRKVDVHDKGVTALYYDSGKEVALEEFDNSGNTVRRQGVIPDGPVKQYFDNGQVAAEWNYLGGRKDGMARRYSERGIIQSETMYRGGRKNGLSKEYYSDGKIQTEDQFSAGVLNGICKFYLKDGTLFREATYKDGKQDGPARTFFASGKVGEEVVYREGKREGTAKSYVSDTAAKPSLFCTFSGDRLVQVKQFGPDGKFISGKDFPAAQ